MNTVQFEELLKALSNIADESSDMESDLTGIENALTDLVIEKKVCNQTLKEINKNLIEIRRYL